MQFWGKKLTRMAQNRLKKSRKNKLFEKLHSRSRNLKFTSSVNSQTHFVVSPSTKNEKDGKATLNFSLSKSSNAPFFDRNWRANASRNKARGDGVESRGGRSFAEIISIERRRKGFPPTAVIYHRCRAALEEAPSVKKRHAGLTVIGRPFFPPRGGPLAIERNAQRPSK